MREMLKQFTRRMSYNFKASKLIFKNSPGAFIAELLNSITAAAIPLVTIWFSARIINELAGSRNPEIIRHLVLLQIISGTALLLLSGIFSRWCEFNENRIRLLEDKIYFDKFMEMEFDNIDSSYVRDLYNQISQNRNWSEYGLAMCVNLLRKTLNGLMKIIGGLSLSVSLFSSKVIDLSNLGFLNRSFINFAIISCVFIIAILSALLMGRAELYWPKYAQSARLGNRIVGFFIFGILDRKRAMDIRMYDQYDNICRPIIDDHDLFGINSPISKMAAGPMGLGIAASTAINAFIAGIIYLFVCLKAKGGAFEVGSVTQYIGAVSTVYSGVFDLLLSLGETYVSGDFYSLSLEFLGIKNKMYKGSLSTEKRHDRQYEVEFKNVSFKYPGTDFYALKNINLKFKIGSRLAIVGENGSGKTTFIKLLCRLYDPDEGVILLNGVDIKKYSYREYIDLFAVVFQDYKLFSFPLGQNVAGSLSYDDSKVRECLKSAGFENIEKVFPNGTDTFIYKDVSDTGVDVSGGESQKIAIARALYKDAPFIILDEPTASLDPVAEAEIYSKFNEISGDKTAIYISHRLSSCKFCDDIAVFHKGEIIQKGPHSELIRDSDGKYFELWNSQAQYYV